jgi:uncharacterized membrane protein YqjE
VGRGTPDRQLPLCLMSVNSRVAHMAARQTASSDSEETRRGAARPEKDVLDISQGIFRDIATLLSTELQLLRAEVSEKLSLTGLAAALIGTGALLLMATIVLLLQAAIAGLVAYGFSPTAATLLVAVATLLLGAVLVWFGLNRLSAQNLAPSKTIHQVEKDATMVSDR